MFINWECYLLKNKILYTPECWGEQYCSGAFPQFQDKFVAWIWCTVPRCTPSCIQWVSQTAKPPKICENITQILHTIFAGLWCVKKIYTSTYNSRTRTSSPGISNTSRSFCRCGWRRAFMISTSCRTNRFSPPSELVRINFPAQFLPLLRSIRR